MISKSTRLEQQQVILNLFDYQLCDAAAAKSEHSNDIRGNQEPEQITIVNSSLAGDAVFRRRQFLAPLRG